DLLFECKGLNGGLQVYKDRVVITRKGLGALASHGLAGEKSISLESISSIQFKEGGWLSGNGLIRFSYSGGSSTSGGLTEDRKDEKEVVFTKGQTAKFRQAKTTIEEEKRKGGIA